MSKCQWFVGNNQILLWLPGKAPGKARPRYSKKTRKFHLPQNYVQWKNNAIVHIKSNNFKVLPQPCFIECKFVNFASSDSDNLTGSILDAFVDAGILSGDSKSYVTGSLGRFWKIRKQRGKDKVIGILVIVTPADIEYLPEEESSLLLSFAL